MSYNHSSGSISGLESPLKQCRQGKESSRIPTKAMTTLDTTQLERLILDHQKLNKKITTLIETGVSLIQHDKYYEAINYFQQAENILEYAASCGKSLNRILIVATLQNKACIYQRLWEQEKSYNYIQAILYNINNNQLESQFHRDEDKSLSVALHRKQSLALYHLKFSAVASQIKNHEIALNSAFKAINYIKSICKLSYNYLLKDKQTDQSRKPLQILKQINENQQKLQAHHLDSYLKRAKSAILEAKNEKSNQLPKQVLQQIQSFTIGQVMQIFPVNIIELTTIPSLQQQLSYIGSIFRALYFSISYFAVATQLRLLTPSKVSIHKHNNSEQFIKSEIYHLNAIYIAAKLVPCSTKYLNHIIKSYSNHYESEIKEYYQQQPKTSQLVQNVQKMEKQQKFKSKNIVMENKQKRIQTVHKNNEKYIEKTNGSEMKITGMFKSKKSGKRNSSAEINNGRSKKSLHKQKSTCNIKQVPNKNLAKNQQIINAYNEQPLQKKYRVKTKIESTKNLKSTKSIHNKSSKSKSKSPSVNLQKKKITSPNKKQKKNIKFQQQYYLQTGNTTQKKKQNRKKKDTSSKINQCKERVANQYTADYLKSSSSKLQELGKSLKSGIHKDKKNY